MASEEMLWQDYSNSAC